MKAKNQLSLSSILVLLLGFFLRANSALPADHLESVPLGTSGTPASDLVYQSHPLNPEEAGALRKAGQLDLSSLDPDTSGDLWKGESSALTSEIPAMEIPDGSVVEFLRTIPSLEGWLNFNIKTRDPDPRWLTVTLGVTAHTLLLRRALLVRLGYVVPAMVHCPKLRVHFPDVATKQRFMKISVVYATSRAPGHWVPDPAEIKSDALDVNLQDVVIGSTDQHIFNLAVAAPTLNSSQQTFPLTERYRRALLVPYALTDLDESVNEFAWTVGAVSDQAVVLPAPQAGEFNCKREDAQWILKKIAKLKREELTAIVEGASFPKEVALLVTEKLISRRNYLMTLFQVPGVPVPFDSKISYAPALKNGKLLTKDWPGYASRFAYGDPDSPIKGLGYFALSVIESNAISNLITKANLEIPSLSVGDAVASHNQSLVNKQLAEFLTSGAVTPIRLKTWFSPITEGSFVASRSIVLGNYLGTNNLVQIADTIGASGSVGMYVGLDGTPGALGVSGAVSGTLNVSYTHLKPVLDLKTAVKKQKFKNLFVPWLQIKAAKSLARLAEIGKSDGDSQSHESDEISSILDQVRQYLDVGESLIITKSLNATEAAQASLSSTVPLAPSVIGELGFNQMLVSRLQIYRNSQDTIQVFKDRGELGGLQFTAEFTLGSQVTFPVFSLTFADERGHANLRFFEVNIHPNFEKNPHLFENAAALAATLNGGSVEALEKVVPPYRIGIHFNDASSSLSFFHWRRRGLKTEGAIEVESPEGDHGKYLSLTSGLQTGKHYESLATDAASYLAERLTGGEDTIQTQSASNAGQSFKGSSHTRMAEFQAREDQGIVDPVVQVSYRWEGWSISAPELQKQIDKLATKYQFEFFPPETLHSVKSIKLYELVVSLVIHREGLMKLANQSLAEKTALEKKYFSRHGCESYPSHLEAMNGDDETACAALRKFNASWDSYQKQLRKPKPSPKAAAQALFEMGDQAERFIPFTELGELLGGEKNYLLFSEIMGYRLGAEEISTPIISNTRGISRGIQGQGPLDQVQNLLGIQSGEFNAYWIRELL